MNLSWSEKSDAELRLAVDMDEVLADTLGKQLALYNRHYGASVVPNDLNGVELSDIVPPEHRQWVIDVFHGPGFFADIQPVPGALEVMERLCRKHSVYIASAATEFPGSFRDKMNWLARYLPQIPTTSIIFCGEKSVLGVDYLVDDSPYHFEGLRGVGLLFDAPHNRPRDGREDRYIRVHGWDQLEAAIELHEARKRVLQ
jgi:5'(3')-deoxyribonucleotidase